MTHRGVTFYFQSHLSEAVTHLIHLIPIHSSYCLLRQTYRLPEMTIGIKSTVYSVVSNPAPDNYPIIFVRQNNEMEMTAGNSERFFSDKCDLQAEFERSIIRYYII